jgi:hypothetical protein
MMSQLTLELPQTLADELELLASDEGVSLERYILSMLTQKVTLTKLAFQQQKPSELTPEQVRLLAQVQPASETELQEQIDAFAALRARPGPPASDEEMRVFLATREQAMAEPALSLEAVARFREHLGE